MKWTSWCILMFSWTDSLLSTFRLSCSPVTGAGVFWIFFFPRYQDVFVCVYAIMYSCEKTSNGKSKNGIKIAKIRFRFRLLMSTAAAATIETNTKWSLMWPRKQRVREPRHGKMREIEGGEFGWVYTRERIRNGVVRDVKTNEVFEARETPSNTCNVSRTFPPRRMPIFENDVSRDGNGGCGVVPSR